MKLFLNRLNYTSKASYRFYALSSEISNFTNYYLPHLQ